MPYWHISTVHRCNNRFSLFTPGFKEGLRRNHCLREMFSLMSTGVFADVVIAVCIYMKNCSLHPILCCLNWTLNSRRYSSQPADSLLTFQDQTSLTTHIPGRDSLTIHIPGPRLGPHCASDWPKLFYYCHPTLSLSSLPQHRPLSAPCFINTPTCRYPPRVQHKATSFFDREKCCPRTIGNLSTVPHSHPHTRIGSLPVVWVYKHHSTHRKKEVHDGRYHFANTLDTVHRPGARRDFICSQSVISSPPSPPPVLPFPPLLTSTAKQTTGGALSPVRSVFPFPPLTHKETFLLLCLRLLETTQMALTH